MKSAPMAEIPDWTNEEQPWYEQLYDPTPDYEFYDFDEPEVDDPDHEGTLADQEYDRGEHE